MRIDQGKYLEDGYVILRQAVPPKRLEGLRLLAELMVDRTKALSAAARTPEQPTGGAWYANPQPRVEVPEVVDDQTAGLVDFCLGENTLGIASQITRAPHTFIRQMQISCSTHIDYGYTDWHRDSSATEQTPLFGLAQDQLENNPGYVQWNVALYDDDVFWLVPGSHARADTEEERRALMLDPRTQLPTGVCADLKAGDAIAYSNLIMHWGSCYTSKLRRTLHLGYRSFGGEIFSYSNGFSWGTDISFTRHLSPAATAHFEAGLGWHRREMDEIEAALRAIIQRDAKAFLERLGRLHPGASQRMTTVVLLSRLAAKAHLLTRPEVALLPREKQAPLVAGPVDNSVYFDLGDRFTPAETECLQARFTRLNALLEQDRGRVHSQYAGVFGQLRPGVEPPDFESRPLRQFQTDMPEGFGVEQFVASWT